MSTVKGRAESAVARWASLVEADREQTARVAAQDAGGPTQRWAGGRAEAFRADPRRQGDPAVELIGGYLGSNQTLLDVGAGAGRLALPLTFHCEQVTAVEAAPPMAAILKEEAASANIANVTLIEGRWQDVEAPDADVVLCYNVLNYVPDIDVFLTKLNGHAREQVLVVLMEEPPMAHFYPFWRAVFAAEPARTPALGELLSVLWELDIHPDVRMLPPRPRVFASRDAVRDQMRQHLGIAPDSAEDGALETAMGNLLTETDAGLVVRGASIFREALVAWKPRAD